MKIKIKNIKNNSSKDYKEPLVQRLAKVSGLLGLVIAICCIAFKLTYLAIILAGISAITVGVAITKYVDSILLALTNYFGGLMPVGYVYLALNYSILPISTHLFFIVVITYPTTKIVFRIVDKLVRRRTRRF